MHVLVIGAGCTGLALAQGLRKADIPFTVYERHTLDHYVNRPRDWGIAVAWGHEHLRTLVPTELYTRLHEADSNPAVRATGLHYPYVNGKTGEPLFFIDAPDGQRYSRRKLKSLLGESIDVQYGKEIISFETSSDGIIARFADGSSATGTILIGCDGSKSRVRELAFDHDPAGQAMDSGGRVINFTTTFPEALARKLRSEGAPINICGHPDFDLCYYVALTDILNEADPKTWIFQIALTLNASSTDTLWSQQPSLSQSQQSCREFISSISKFFVDPWKLVSDNLPLKTQFPYEPYLYWKPIPWNTRGGRVTLAGDAAHTLPPHRGQGYNNSLLDCVNLVSVLKEVDMSGDSSKETNRHRLEEAVNRYNQEMIERMRPEVESSIQAMDAASNFEKIMQHPLAKLGLDKSREDRASDLSS